MVRLRAQKWGFPALAVLGLIAHLLVAIPVTECVAQSEAGARTGELPVGLSKEDAQRLVESGISPGQARGILLERGYSPSEVDGALAPFLESQITVGDSGRAGMSPLPSYQVPAPAEPSSRAEKTPVSELLPGPKEGEIQPFGYRLFGQGPSSFVPPERVAVGPDYLLGPDDVVVINTWGAAELNYSLTISPEGHVVIREIGVVYLSGTTLADARLELKGLFNKFYPGIRIHVTVGRLRTLRVYVVGEVVQPGAYTVSSLSTVLTALYYAGGPNALGSLRNIRLIRDNEVLGIVDLYEYLLRGDRTYDLRLENEDTIFVPPVGFRVTLRGEVRRPAIYEVLPSEDLDDVIRMAGGVLATGYLKRVQIDRILDNEKHVIMDIDAVPSDSLAVAFNVPLSDGDEISVLPVLEGYENAVWIRGAVRRPGRYELKPDMTLLGLITAAEGLVGEAYLPRVEIQRTEPNEQIRFLAPDLGAILRGTEPDLPLVPRDSVRVYSAWEMKDRDEVEIFGEIRRPGRYALGSNMTLRDLVFRAGGLRESAHLMRAEISRTRQPTKDDPRRNDVIPVKLTDVVSGRGDDSPGVLLQAGDKVFVRRIPQWDVPHMVEITGEVRFPGTYVVSRADETLSEMFQRAGGVGEWAFLDAAVLERENVGRVVVDFSKAVLDRNEQDDIILEDGDRIHVPRIPETVEVRGAVFQPSSLKFVPGKTAGYYAQKCGGYLERADSGKVRITRSNGAVVTSRRFWFDPNVERGNIIVVPFKEEKKAINWEKIADVAQVIASLATTVYLFDQAFGR